MWVLTHADWDHQSLITLAVGKGLLVLAFIRVWLVAIVPRRVDGLKRVLTTVRAPMRVKSGVFYQGQNIVIYNVSVDGVLVL